MCDSDNDSECLRIHQGYRRDSDESSSDNDSEHEAVLEETFKFLQPDPIPAEEIRAKAIYRPPTPDNVLSTPQLCPTSQIEVVSEERNAILPEERITPFTREKPGERLLHYHLKIANLLVEVQRALCTYSSIYDGAQWPYLHALEEFSLSVDNFSKNLNVLQKEKYDIIDNAERSEELVALEICIRLFKNLLTYFYAFIVSECLQIIRKIYQSGKIMNSYINKAICIIKSIGQSEEIKKKIKNIRYDVWEDLPPHNYEIDTVQRLSTLKLSYSDMIKELDIFVPENNVKRKSRKIPDEILYYLENKNKVENDSLKLYSTIEPPNYLNFWSTCRPGKQNNLIFKIENSRDNFLRYSEFIQQTCVPNQRISLQFQNDLYNEDSHLMDYEVGKVICEIMNDPRDRDFVLNSTMRSIKYAYFNTLITLNVLQFSVDTTEIKYSVATLDTIQDLSTILIELNQLNHLLKVTTSKNSMNIIESIMPISEISENYSYYFVLSECSQLIESLQFNSEKKLATLLFCRTCSILQKLLNIENLHERLNKRNDELYVKYSRKFCSGLPAPSVLPNRTQIFKQLLVAINTSKEHVSCPAISNDFSNWTKIKTRCMDLNVFRELIVLQNSIKFNLENNLENFEVIIRHIRIYFELLNRLEINTEPWKLGSFVHKYLDKLNSIVGEHIFKICNAQFYCYILSMFPELFKIIVIHQKPADSYFNQLIDILRRSCHMKRIFRKLEYRNDALYLKYCDSFPNIKGIIIPDKSSFRIHSELTEIFAKFIPSNDKN